MADATNDGNPTARAGHMQYVPVRWSAATRSHLSKLVELSVEGLGTIDRLTSSALLAAGDGDFEAAEKHALEAYRAIVIKQDINPANFLAVLNALLCVQRLDLVANMLRTRYAPSIKIEVRIEEQGPGVDRLRWEIDSAGRHTFIFDGSLLRPARDFYGLRHFNAVCPLLFNYASSSQAESGTVILNQSDRGLTPGLSYCDSRPDYFLIPDYVFVAAQGYRYERHHFTNNYVPWSERSQVAFWRGATTGVCSQNAWRTLERIRLCELAQRDQLHGHFDVGISSVAQFTDPATINEIEASGLMRGRVPWQNWNTYKYLVDIDGNSSPWSNLFQRLLTGSPVLKVESYRGLRQWFYDDLVAWDNYVPIASDASDLVEKVRWLVRHDAIAEQIGQRGRQLALRLTYETELARSIPVISAAFRENKGGSADLLVVGNRPGRLASEQVKASSKYTENDVDTICRLLEQEGFSVDEYVSAYKDLAKYGSKLPAIVEHLFSHGAAEGRRLAVRDPHHLISQFEQVHLTTHGRSTISPAIAKATLSARYYSDGLAPSTALLNEKHAREAAILQPECDSKTLASYIKLLNEINCQFAGIADFRWPAIPHPLYFRAGSTDLQNFKQIFVAKEYDFALPFVPRRILDLGAYVGYAAVFLAHRFPDAEIVCVEPSVENFRMLTLNTSTYPNIRCINAAAWGTSSRVRVDRYFSGDWGTHLVESGVATEGTLALSLSDILDTVHWTDVDFLKCDIEGSEQNVFSESRSLIGQMVHCCAVETHDAAAPGSSAAVAACFDASVFSHFRSGEYNVYIRRSLEDKGFHTPTIYLLRPTAGLRGIALAEVPRQPWGYYMFDGGSCQLHPTCRSVAPAELATILEFSGQSVFDCEVSVESPLGFGVTFSFDIFRRDSDTPIAGASIDVAAGEAQRWSVRVDPISGLCRVALRTAMIRDAPTNHRVVANWINPKFIDSGSDGT